MPAFPVYGFTFPFVDQLFRGLLSGVERLCGPTYVPSFVTWPFTVVDEDLAPVPADGVGALSELDFAAELALFDGALALVGDAALAGDVAFAGTLAFGAADAVDRDTVPWLVERADVTEGVEGDERVEEVLL